MTTKPKPQIKKHKSKQFHLDHFDDFPNIDLKIITHQNHLINQPNIDNTKHVFQQLNHLNTINKNNYINKLNDLFIEHPYNLNTNFNKTTNNLNYVDNTKIHIT